MATALQCPACGHKHRLDGPRSEPSFPCSSCGQTLKVPAQFHAKPAPTTPAAVAPVAAPMRPIIGHNQRRVDATTAPALGEDDEFFDDDVIDDEFLDEEIAAGAPSPVIGAKVALTRSQRRAVMDPKLPWWGRVLSWGIALPLGAMLVLVPLRLVRFLSGSYLLGVLSETGVRRFGRLAIALLAWSVVTAIIVQAISWFYRRRRVHQLQESAAATVDLALAEHLSV